MLSSTRDLCLVSSQVGGRNWQRQVPGFCSHWDGKEKKCNTLLTSVSQINYSLGFEQRQMLKRLEVKQQLRCCVLIVGETQELKGKTTISLRRSFCKSGYLVRTQTQRHPQIDVISFRQCVLPDVHGNWPIKKVPLTSSPSSPRIDTRGISGLLVSLNLPQSSPHPHRPGAEFPRTKNQPLQIRSIWTHMSCREFVWLSLHKSSYVICETDNNTCGGGAFCFLQPRKSAF